MFAKCNATQKIWPIITTFDDSQEARDKFCFILIDRVAKKKGNLLNKMYARWAEINTVSFRSAAAQDNLTTKKKLYTKE